MVFLLYFIFNNNNKVANNNFQLSYMNNDSLPELLINKNQYIDTPDYVPPKNGINNRYWCGYGHRYLLKERKCYFGNSLKNRYRWGQRQ
jgi:hypothetical protein